MLKVGGLDAEQLCRRAVPPSSLSLVGVVRHLTEVEAYWVRYVLAGEDVPDLHSTKEYPDGDFDLIDPGTAIDDVAGYQSEVERCRDVLRTWTDPTAPARRQRHDRDVNLVWILAHLVQEYARHLGHMDLLRECVDGSTGY